MIEVPLNLPDGTVIPLQFPEDSTQEQVQATVDSVLSQVQNQINISANSPETKVSQDIDLTLSEDDLANANIGIDVTPSGFGSSIESGLSGGRTPSVEGEQFFRQGFADLPEEQRESLLRAREERLISAGIEPTEIKSVAAQRGAFPDQRGESFASKNLPELGGSGLLAGEDAKKVLSLAPVLLATTDTTELANILASSFDNIGISQASDGELLATNNSTGAQVVLNRPGLSRLDLMQFLGLSTAFTPANLGFQGVSRQALTQLAARNAATQGVIEASQAAAGGDFDTPEVALAGVLAPVSQVGAEKVITPLATRAAERISRNVNPDAQAIIQAGQEANVPVLTTDVAPPKGRFSNLARQLSESVPLPAVGSGAARSKQRIMRDLAAKTKGDNLEPFSEREIVESLRKKSGKVKKAAGDRLDFFNRTLDKDGQLPTKNIINAIDSELSKLTKSGLVQDQPTVALISRIRQDIEKAPDGVNFSTLRDNRTQIRELSENIDGQLRSQQVSTSKVAVDNITRAITKELDNVVESRLGKKAFDRYKKADAVWASQAELLQNSRLKSVLDKGEIQPEQVNNLLFSRDKSQRELLYNGLTKKGRDNARASILNRAFEKATNDLGEVNPTVLSRQLDNLSGQFDSFFKGEELNKIKGFQRLLAATRRGQETGVSTNSGQAVLLPLYSLIGGGSVAGNPTAQAALAAGGTISTAARLYESKPVRNLLVGLSKVKPNSAKERELIDKFAPRINAFAQSLRAQGEENATTN